MNSLTTETIAANDPGSFPLISVIIPCYNHGTYLYECLNSVTGQTYHPLEIIVIDDGSEDAYTRDVLEILGRDKRLTIIRQPNCGPSAARNRAIGLAKGRYVLPVDADNYLAPNAIESLHDVIRTAPDNVKFVYQNQQFFGNRTDYAVQPSYNLYSLLQDNYCDTCALIDRSVFDEGIQFREEIGLGHEDWDFFLQLAERGYVGRPCPTKSLFYRKQGFTRSDSVIFNFGRFQEQMRELHPDLYRPDRLLAIKRQWSPALSVVMDWEKEVDPDILRCLIPRLRAQTCLDFDLIVPDYLADVIQDAATSDDSLPYITRVATTSEDGGEGATPQARRVRALLEKARGKYFLLWAHPAIEPFDDPACIEKAVRLIENSWSSHCVVLLAAKDDATRTSWKPISEDDMEESQVHCCLGLLVRANALIRKCAEVDLAGNENIYAALISFFLRLAERDDTCLQWRTHNVMIPTTSELAVKRPPSEIPRVNDQMVTADADENAVTSLFPLFGAGFFTNWSDEIEFSHRMSTRPMFIQMDKIVRQPVLRAEQKQSRFDPFHHEFLRGWQPENTVLLHLVHHPQSDIYYLSTNPQEYYGHGFYTSAILGRVYNQQFVGTIPLIRVIDPRTVQSTYSTEPVSADAHPAYLGFVSASPLIGMLGLLQMMHVRTRRRIITTNISRAIADGFQFEMFLGFIEPVELEPQTVERSAFCRAIDRKVNDNPWVIYETEIPAARDYLYTLHPDLAVLSNCRVRMIGQIYVTTTPQRLPLYKLANPATHRHIYRTQLGTELEEGYQLEGLIGYIPVVAHDKESPLYCYDVAGANRLREIGTMHEANGHLLVGVIGCAKPAAGNRVPLYRWYHPHEGLWTCSTTEDAGQRLSEGYQLEGVLGLAYLSEDKEIGLVGLSETRATRTGQMAYDAGATIATQADAAHKRIIAYLSTVKESHSIPLFCLHDIASDRFLYTVNPDEKIANGFVTETIVGYLDAAVPPFSSEAFFPEHPGLQRIRSCRPGETEPIIHGLVYIEQQADTIPLFLLTPDDARDDQQYVIAPDENRTAERVGFILIGPKPGSVPLYRYLHSTSGHVLLSTNPRLVDDGYLIQSVVGFLLAFDELRSQMPAENGHVKNDTAPLDPEARLRHLETVTIPTKNEHISFTKDYISQKDEHISSLEGYIRQVNTSAMFRGLRLLTRSKGILRHAISRLRETGRVIRS